jgi:hypothetical protein
MQIDCRFGGGFASAPERSVVSLEQIGSYGWSGLLIIPSALEGFGRRDWDGTERGVSA